MEDKTKYQLKYLVMPEYLYKETRLTLIAIKVYCFIHAYTNPFKFGNDHLAEMFSCNPQAISDAIQMLVKYDYVKTEYKPKGGGGKLRLVIDTYSDKSFGHSGFEATTSHKDIDKENKVNTIKVKNFGKGTVDEQALDNKRKAVEYRNSRKGKGLRGRVIAQQFTAGKFEKKVKLGTYAEDIR